tara:strand:- start:896 stop:1642 length:747 start_codon:yes stop_codon:yes gene_type:complete
MDKLLKQLYLRNFFRTAVNISKFLSIFNKKYKDRVSFFNFFKKRKKKYEKQILEILYRPKIFILQFSYDTEKIIDKIYKYNDLYKENEFSKDGHIGVYQSKHNLEKEAAFMDVYKSLEFYINTKLQDYTNHRKLGIDKLWFVITKKSGIIKKHSHFNSDFSGAFYLKVDENVKNNNGLRIYNTGEEIEIYKYSEFEGKFIKSICRDSNFLLKPNKMDLIIFNSYIEHSVENEDSKIIDRISLPFNLIF